MKKILSVLLALTMVLALSVNVFAVDNSGEVGPDPTLGVSVNAINKFSYSATDANGLPANVIIYYIGEGDVYDEVKGYGLCGLYNVTVISPSSGTVTVDVYAPGATSDSIVIVRDAWEVLEGANLIVDGDRATFTFPVDLANTYHYFAIVNSFDIVDTIAAVDVETPMEPGDQTSDDENVNVNDNETDAPSEAPVDSNPPTGVALAVVPMIVAAAAIVVSKRR